MAVIITRHSFDAAHRIIGIKSKCERLHGHTYTLEVHAEGPVKDNGMVMDFSHVKAIVKEHILKQLDHNDLNKVLPVNPTAENIALWILKKLQPLLGLTIRTIRLWETPNACVEVSADDLSDL